MESSKLKFNQTHNLFITPKITTGNLLYTNHTKRILTKNQFPTITKLFKTNIQRNKERGRINLIMLNQINTDKLNHRSIRMFKSFIHSRDNNNRFMSKIILTQDSIPKHYPVFRNNLNKEIHFKMLNQAILIMNQFSIQITKWKKGKGNWNKNNNKFKTN